MGCNCQKRGVVIRRAVEKVQAAPNVRTAAQAAARAARIVAASLARDAARGLRGR